MSTAALGFLRCPVPKHSVPNPRQQAALYAARHLLPPADAALELGVTRQAIAKSASRPRGHMLEWVFVDSDRGASPLRSRYIDFGAREGERDPSAWQTHRSNPAALLDAAVALATVATSAVDSEPPVQGTDEMSLLLLGLIATGIAAFARRPTETPVVPYPAALQKGLDKLSLRCFRQGIPAPEGVPDLLRWGRERPLAEWPLTLDPDAASRDDRFLTGALPTAFCLEWEVVGREAEAELEERRLLHAVLSSCRQAHDQAGYVAFRRLLIDRPLLTNWQLAVECGRPELARLKERIKEVYEPAPLEYAEGDVLPTCGRCGNPLARIPGTSRRCADDRCAREPLRIGPSIQLREEPLWLQLPFRIFVSTPGRAELRLAERLATLGCSVLLWPNLDAYDVRVGFPDGEAWAVDVKDWSSPVALAYHLDRTDELFRREPSWERAFFVFPRERLAERPQYVRAFATACRTLREPRVSALGEDDFLAAVRRRLRKEDR